MVVRRGLSPLERLLHEDVDGRAVLGVHHDQPAVARGRLHRLQDLPVARQEHTRVGHEELEAGDALADQLVHRLERVGVDVADDLVERVVDGAVAAGFLVPQRNLVLDVLALGLHHEVDDRGGAAPRGGAGAGLECVGGLRAAEGHFHVSVPVHAARDDVLAGRVDDGVGADRAERGGAG